ncbi:MAG: hypothetical protein WA865_11740 [Spirulinaceae cyanobacterium]
MKYNKRSKIITLVWIASVSLVACQANQGTYSRNVYRTKQDCQKDWGYFEECEQFYKYSGASNSSTGATYYSGPRYLYINRRLHYLPKGSSKAKAVPNTVPIQKTGPKNSARSLKTVQTQTGSAKSNTSGKKSSRGGFGSTGKAKGGGKS